MIPDHSRAPSLRASRSLERAKQSGVDASPGLLRRFAPRNDEWLRSVITDLFVRVVVNRAMCVGNVRGQPCCRDFPTE
ncbi:MAG: hypothetical protein LBT00_03760 [Spirochaetaceae bacterium]|nr:hypothetical protein [Spirochaetaceae bacterium]